MPSIDQDSRLQDCIDQCTDCAQTCEEILFQHCLEKGGAHMTPAHVRLMADCVAICQTSASFMLRGSDMHGEVCRACAAICEACADSCAAIDDDDMQDCAETCRACAEECRTMAMQSQTGGQDRRQSPAAH